MGDRRASTQEARSRLVDLYEAWGRAEEATRHREEIPAIAVATVTDLDSLELADRPEGGYSALVDRRSVWVFAGAWGSTDDLDARDGDMNNPIV